MWCLGVRVLYGDSLESFSCSVNYQELSMSAGDTAEQISNNGVPVIIIVVIGYLMARFGSFPAEKALPFLNKFVFYLGIPALVFKGLASNDFINGQGFNWDFILAFLVLRIVIGIFSFTYTYVERYFFSKRNKEEKSNSLENEPKFIENFLVYWISETYLNTLIFGIPILSSIYGARSLVYNVYASLSSLFFQLPVLITFFEYRELKLRILKASQSHEKHKQSNNDDVSIELLGLQNEVPKENEKSSDSGSASAVEEKSNQKEMVPLSEHGVEVEDEISIKEDLASRRWYVIRLCAKAILTNPPFIGILCGIIYSLALTSTSNFVYVDNTGKHIKPVILDTLLGWLGSTVTPVASFCIGLFAYLHFTPDNFRKLWLKSIVLLMVKFTFVPLLSIPLMLMFNLEGSIGRIGVLIAALPIALASFTLTENYGCGNKAVALQVVIGTILMTPVTIAWDQIMQSLDLFGQDTLRLS